MNNVRFRSVAFNARQFDPKVKPWPNGVEVILDEEEPYYVWISDDQGSVIDEGDWLIQRGDDEQFVCPPEVFDDYFEPYSDESTETEPKWVINNLDAVAQRIAEWRQSKGFYTPDSFDNAPFLLERLMLVVTEVAEAAEAVRKNDYDNFIEELADTVIRVLDLTGTMKIALASAIVNKMTTNETRPLRHGKRA